LCTSDSANSPITSKPVSPAPSRACARCSSFTAASIVGTAASAVIPAAGGGAQVTVDVPHVKDLDPSLPAPTITGIVYWIDAAGSHELARGTETFMANLGAPGAYRIEIRITPSHLGPYLRDLGSAMAEKELPWIYTSPFYVE
jgi:hypothetical protein